MREIKKASGQLRSLAALEVFYNERWKSTKERVLEGEPWGICELNEAEEIFLAMDIPYIMGLQGWLAHAPSHTKQAMPLYLGALNKEGYNQCGHCGMGLASAIVRDPQIEPLGKKVKAPIVVRTTDCEAGLKLSETLARKYNGFFFPLQLSYFYHELRTPRWWEKIRDHWDEVIDPHRIDMKVEELKGLIKFLEVTTGKTFSITKLTKVMELVNEQNDYFRKARDLIAETTPCPVTVAEHAIYGIQSYRGTEQARDIVKMFYEDVKERVEKGEAPCPNEKIRLMWAGSGLKSNRAFYRSFEDKYNATFVCSGFLSVGADCYARAILNNDPLRALAGRYVFLGNVRPNRELLHREAKLFKINGVVAQLVNKSKDCPMNILNPLNIKYFEKLGIPTCSIYADSRDIREWDEARVKAQVSQFIEEKLLQ
jgi:rRNA processing protein Krr1/Pno1